ncbi:tyrosine-type recombinase/integrase [Novosphingobium percolationis]|uniref:tyrosine-type recombinase/integrase n=1 Tax=Novosphingobium percolationis TaxID=2871811 RepID=UPI001CD23B16|nr:site-specific integrase [Novosphingobium percolationis]
MARTVRDYRLETRAARARLGQRTEPYWMLLSEGFHLGYYRGRQTAKWVARHRPAGQAAAYTKTTLGEADDTSDADGVRILDYRQAQDKAREWLRAVEGGVAVTASFTVGDALDEYLKAFTKKDLANTKRRVEQFVRPALGNVRLARLTAAQVRGFLNDRANTPARLRTRKGEEQKVRPLDTPEAMRRRKSTANRDLTVLKAALNLAFANGRIASDHAWRTVKPFKNVDGAKLRYLSDDEARRLVNACSPEFRPIVQAALLTGARWGELRNVSVVDFDLRAGTVRLVETKGGQPRDCYLEGEGLALFKAHTIGKAGDAPVFPAPGGARWTDSTQIRRMTLACEAGNVTPPAAFHDLRRTFGARLALAGVPMAVIAQALGHKDERITRKHYAHLSPSYVADTVRQHTAGLGIVDTSPDNVTDLRSSAAA